MAIAAVAALGASGTAAAQGSGDGDKPAREADDVPARVSVKLRRTVRALNRATDYLDDGETAKAQSAFAAVRRNLTSATSRTERRIAGASDSATACAEAVAKVSHRVIDETVASLDGLTGDAVGSVTATFENAIENRDRVVAAIVGTAPAAASIAQNESAPPPAENEPVGDYQDALTIIVRGAKGEIGDVEETIAEDALTPAAKSALENALIALRATKASAKAALNGEAAPPSDDPPKKPAPSDDA